VRKDLEGNVTPQLLVVGAKDHAHAACSNLFDQAIVSEYLPDAWSRH
jgi:hypothetical protein